MPLPFLQKKYKDPGISIEYRTPDKEAPEADGLESCAEELIKATKADDKKAAAKALRNAFQILDSEPHDEGPHLNEEEEGNDDAA